jgi:hypothetical protein
MVTGDPVGLLIKPVIDLFGAKPMRRLRGPPAELSRRGDPVAGKAEWRLAALGAFCLLLDGSRLRDLRCDVMAAL